jgi:NADPH-dependent curcumin reductase CurA
VSILPRVAPRFNTAGDVAGFDDVLSAKNRTNLDDVLQRQYHGIVDTIDLYFDIDNVRVKNSKADYQEISVSNLTPCPSIW